MIKAINLSIGTTGDKYSYNSRNFIIPVEVEIHNTNIHGFVELDLTSACISVYKVDPCKDIAFRTEDMMYPTYRQTGLASAMRQYCGKLRASGIFPMPYLLVVLKRNFSRIPYLVEFTIKINIRPATLDPLIISHSARMYI